jgi:prevent-host-death family protein
MADIERIPAEMARKAFSRIIDEAGFAHTTRIITKNGRDRAVIMSVDDYRHYQALEDYIDGLESEKAYAQYVAEGGVSWDDVKRQLDLD